MRIIDGKVVDFDERLLRGSLVEYWYGSSIDIGLVVGIDRDIGITIVNQDDEEDMLVCFPGPKSKKFEKDGIPEDHYYKVFGYLAECILKGNPIIIEKASLLAYGYEDRGGTVNNEKCPYR